MSWQMPLSHDVGKQDRKAVRRRKGGMRPRAGCPSVHGQPCLLGPLQACKMRASDARPTLLGGLTVPAKEQLSAENEGVGVGRKGLGMLRAARGRWASWAGPRRILHPVQLGSRAGRRVSGEFCYSAVHRARYICLFPCRCYQAEHLQ